MREEVTECVLKEPLTQSTAVVVVDIFPGNVHFVEYSIGEVVHGRPDIVDGGF